MFICPQIKLMRILNSNCDCNQLRHRSYHRRKGLFLLLLKRIRTQKTQSNLNTEYKSFVCKIIQCLFSNWVPSSKIIAPMFFSYLWNLFSQWKKKTVCWSFSHSIKYNIINIHSTISILKGEWYEYNTEKKRPAKVHWRFVFCIAICVHNELFSMFSICAYVIYISLT